MENCPYHQRQAWLLYQADCRGLGWEKHLQMPAAGGHELLFLCLSGPLMSHSPHSQDSGGSDLDLDPTEAKLFPDGELQS